MKKYNFQQIRQKIYKISKNACFSQDNKFTDTVWEFHILPVVKYSLALGKRLKADLEVLEIAALLHDHASLVDDKLYEDHHFHGARMAEKILRNLNFPENKIKMVKNCILNHRGSKPGNRNVLEDNILASADAMSHFSELADMMYLVYGVHRLKTRAGAVWLKNKLLRSWKKIMPKGRKMIGNDRLVAMNILNKAIK